MSDYQDIERMLRGCWPDFIASATGYQIPGFKGAGHPCPQCGGNDRAHWRQKDGRVGLFCRGACGHADSAYGSNTMTTPEQFIMDYCGWSFAEFAAQAEQYLNIAPRNNPKKSKEPVMRSDLKAIVQKATPYKWQESWLCGRFMIKPDELYLIDGIESFPLIGEWSGKLEAFLQVAGYGKHRVLGSMSADGLYCVIGSLTRRKVFFTNIAAAWIYHNATGEQCVFSASHKHYKKSACSAAFVKDGDYETLYNASFAYGVSSYIYPINPTFYEFDRKHAEINHDQLCDFLTGVECGTL